MGPWILQIRGDFMAIACGLLAVRLLLTSIPGAVLAAGAMAGLATQFKFVYVAALVAGFIWLTLERRWRDVVRFAAAGLSTSAGVYALFLLREPALPGHVLVLRHSVKDYVGLALQLNKVFREPAFLLGAGWGLAVIVRPLKRWRLLLIYVVLAFLIGAVADAQVGGNINYFFEVFFGVAPLAAMGVLYLRRLQPATAALFLAALLALNSLEPAAFAVYQSGLDARREKNRNRDLDKLRSVLKGHHVLSTVPTVTFLSDETVVDEPFLLSHLERLGKLDINSLADRLQKQEFELVATAQEASFHRGIPHLSPTLRRPIVQAYEPYCVYRSALFFLRRHSPSPELAERLRSIGCAPCAAGAHCSAW